MHDKEKVELGIKACWSEYFSHKCCDCPYMSDRNDMKCVERLSADALAMLNEQEARILDWDELEDWENAIWFEDKDEHECYIALIANVGTYDAKFVNVEPGMVHRLDFLREFYKKKWRCWSARPTIKQRQAVKLE